MAVVDKFQTKKSYPRDISPRQYKDPGTSYLDYDKIPEGTTFTAPSLAPKEYLLDQNAILPADRNPVDWQMVSETGGPDISTEERNQRAFVRDFLAQKYGQAADTKGVEEALAKQKYENNWADAGYNVDRMLMAHSAARGGPGADRGYWEGQKKAAAGEVETQEGLRQAKIKDYLAKKNLGQQGVEELQQMHGYDITNAQNDPTSDISRSYQNAFTSMFPQEAQDMGGDIPNMSATEIAGIAKMYGAKAETELRRNVEMAKLGYADAGLQMQGRKLANEEAKAGRETSDLAPKTKAEIDKIKADIALTQARTKAVGAGKTGATTAAPGVPGATDAKPTKAYEAVDRDYAKQYNDWTTTGRATYSKNMNILKEAKNTLETLPQAEKSSVSGRFTAQKGKLFDGALRSDKSLRVENDVKQAAQSSLKAILGSAYTAAEGESVMNKSYDVRLPPEENIKKIDRAIEELEQKARAEEERANWFEKRGTTFGFKSSNQSEHEKAVKWARENPNDPRSVEILKLMGGK